MTKREIYNSEQNNTGFIHLYKEGMFYKAYEKSAFLLVNLVHAFKLSCNYVKLVGDYLVYAGFPISSLEKWCGNHDIEDKADYKEIQINGKDVLLLSDYDSWKSSLIEHNTASKSEQYESLPVFGLSFRFNVEICQLCANLNRSYKYSLGEDLRKAALEMLLDIQIASQCILKYDLVHAARIELNRVAIALRILADLKEIKDKRHIYFMEMLEEISQQLASWEKSLQRETPAGMPVQ